jgi:hypothetical protein
VSVVRTCSKVCYQTIIYSTDLQVRTSAAMGDDARFGSSSTPFLLLLWLALLAQCRYRNAKKWYYFRCGKKNEQTKPKTRLHATIEDYGARDFLPCMVTRLHRDVNRRVIGQEILAVGIRPALDEGSKSSPPFETRSSCLWRPDKKLTIFFEEYGSCKSSSVVPVETILEGRIVDPDGNRVA